MSSGEAYRPSDRTLLIYDGSDDQIANMITNVESLLELYTFNLEVLEIKKWSRQDEGVSKVAFCVSVDTELLYRSVKKRLIECPDKKMLLILTYEKYTSKDADNIVKDIQKKRRAKMQMSAVKTKKKVAKANVKDQLLITKVELPSKEDIGIEVNKWFPYLLHLISGKRTYKTNKELGVFYKIDPDIDVQFNWYEKQRQVLESNFHIKCAYSSPEECSDDVYVRNADCVVLYVPKHMLRRLNTLEDQQKSLIELANLQSSCKLYVYFEKIHPSFEKTMEQRYKMSRVGEGALIHWIELLSTLGLITARRRTDWTFYQDIPDENCIARYQPNLERANTHLAFSNDAFDRESENEVNESQISIQDSLTRRPVSRLQTKKDVKEAIFKPYDEGQTQIVEEDEGRPNTRASCASCMPWMGIFSKRRV